MEDYTNSSQSFPSLYVGPFAKCLVAIPIKRWVLKKKKKKVGSIPQTIPGLVQLTWFDQWDNSKH